MSTSFKTSMFGGFDRSDVIAYIERTGREHEERVAALEEDLKRSEAAASKQQKQVEDFQREENRLLPPDADYAAIGGLRVEARQKLNEIRPLSIGQASRISGVSPADIAVLLIWLGQQEQ